ncbi:MAG TPA: plastocyanin/azurin family copper-binding protein [Acidimicrobiales bacterium]
MPVPTPTRRRRTAVALAVAATLLAGCGGDGEDEALPAVDGPVSPRLEVSATEMAFTPDAVAVEAGEVEVVLHNDGTILHDLRIDDQPLLLEAVAGETDTGSIALDPGSYAFFCSLPGHREAGMEGVLEVR